MKQFARDLFYTKQNDETYKLDITNPAFSYVPVTFSILSYICIGLTLFIKHPDLFDLLKFGGGLGGLFTTGYAAVFIHSKSST